MQLWMSRSSVFGLFSFKCHLLMVWRAWEAGNAGIAAIPFLPLEILVHLEVLQWSGEEIPFPTCGAGTGMPLPCLSHFGISECWIWTGPSCCRLSGDVRVTKKSRQVIHKTSGRVFVKAKQILPLPAWNSDLCPGFYFHFRAPACWGQAVYKV